MTLFWIILATTVAGVLSIAAAASLSLTILSRIVDKMVSLSVGVLLSTALLHSLPEAFTSPNIDVSSLFAALFLGLLGFFVLEKAALLRHSHHHEHDGHGHHHGHDAESAGRSGFVILVGDGLHNFADGILIAAAFLADPQVGILTAVAIALHEIPQEVGDFIILLNAGFSKIRALVYNLISSMMAVFGGVLGYFFLDSAQSLIPYVIVFASSSFIYIAVSDLMPQMHKRPRLKESAEQLTLIIFGVVLVLALAELGHIAHA
jgi:zinc and cadmium transporter